MRDRLIQRYEHHGFTGWLVCATRRDRRFRRYFSDHPHGRKKALHAARVFRTKLVARLPAPTKVKRRYIRNTTGVIGVARVKERTRSGKWLVRYVAQWPTSGGGNSARVSFSVGLYGEEEAFRLAALSRRKGLKALMRRQA